MSSIIDEVKKLLEKELKLFNKKLKTISDKYDKISEEHELLLDDIDVLDQRLYAVEKKIISSNNENNKFDKINNKVINDKTDSINNINDIKDISEFRNQIITRSKAKKIMNNTNLKENYEDYVLNNTDIFDKGQKRWKENNKKKRQRYKKNNQNNEYNNEEEIFNKINFEMNNHENSREENINNNKVNSLIIKDNNFDDIDNLEIMSFKNNNNNFIKRNNIPINDKESVISTSDHYSEFSFNPQKKPKNIKPKSQNPNIPKNPQIKNNKPPNDIKNIINSDILKTFKELELIIQALPNYNKFDDLPIIQAIFQSSLNGDSAKNFHKFCDGEPNIIVLIETRKGCRFGGFTNIGFNSDNEVKKDLKSFLFSFDEMKIYKNKKTKNAIYCGENNGPCFGDKDIKDIFIEDNYFNKNSYVGKANGCFFNMNKDFELNGGEQLFIVNKLEVFKLLISNSNTHY